MYQEIDKIYELCKRVINEAPTALVSFDLGEKCLTVYGLKKKKIFINLRMNLSGIFMNIFGGPIQKKKSLQSTRKYELFCLNF